MELGDIIKLNLKEDDIIEICVTEENSPINKYQNEIPIYLAYFKGIVVMSKSQDKDLDKKPPYIEICLHREKHGVPITREQWRPEEIRWISKQGHTAYKELHSHN